ncbi:UDP-N-acetylmuramoyl-L-alanyl-D-glutamate--2,6-diaminopimelate ligase [Lutimonas zeaxanthinifaciens]|uniref:UDP-N-acetylmuramoyl-L-alanyl-D-glutamate--2, 6-diaminopimelate ligase n=1 Tax=Lutimonas zeaxanthinifaciens TaxID=3060215 RepID=UPI00265D1314|nr:UDP-N-acetylmuramoyl-L-alanyl-D-glutamate--2,6-diaminopimelate ligase [Lutimonas sp. YSD2104]WKK65393.1 UDP-N-acetylmuramoyl-L-alanyl-D-glutamate--2,6-diaminopimelate ligase [Lutimonas sp. YSD2104]
MKNLRDILYGVSVESVSGSTDVPVRALEFDSRKISADSVFVAQKGLRFDGHQFIEKAIQDGAKVVICQEFPVKINEEVTFVRVKDSDEALAILAANFYDNPSEELTLVGVTGTNGKTTIATLLAEQFKKAGFKSGLISTIKVVIGEKEIDATHTTPDSLTINRVLREMADLGVSHCFMEVSSHGIHQKRTAGLNFKGGIFTNLTHDHLDYHKTFAEYRDVKKSFFDHLSPQSFALVNIDDKNGQVMLQNTRAKKFSYALKTEADYKARIIENQFNGLLLNIDGQEVWTKLIGTFNAYNLLAIYACSDIIGMDRYENLRVLSELENVSGRFQHAISKGGINAIIDYAHTPDALKNVLETINSIRTFNEQVITVVGCGGDRDKAKRPKMGNIASSLSNQVVFTSDNPRSEDPEEILKEVEAGVRPENYKKTITIVDRKQAIKTACKLANEGDIILVAGKGHETYQIIGNEKTGFDDFVITKQILTELNK